MMPSRCSIAKSMWSGCHICGAGNPRYTYVHIDLFGYYPCYDCWQKYMKQNNFYWDVGSLFDNLYERSGHCRLGYENFVDSNILRDEFGRRLLRQIRNENGIYEPLAYCASCKSIKPLFDMAYKEDERLFLRNNILHYGFVCFECSYYKHHPAKTCIICKRKKHALNNSFVNNVCYSCGEIHDYNERIRENKKILYEEEKIRAEEFTWMKVSNKYCEHLLKLKNIVINQSNIELKRQQLILFRSIKKLKEVTNGLNQRKDHAIQQGNP